MEEDIKILEDLLELNKSKLTEYKSIGVWYNEDTEKYTQCIENLLTRYKQLEEENRKLNNANKTYINAIQSITPVLTKDYIEKSKIKEKKKEKEESFKKTCELHDCDTKFEALNKLRYEIDLCEELLEEE